jgi:hypothetical protein
VDEWISWRGALTIHEFIRERKNQLPVCAAVLTPALSSVRGENLPIRVEKGNWQIAFHGRIHLVCERKHNTVRPLTPSLFYD